MSLVKFLAKQVQIWRFYNIKNCPVFGPKEWLKPKIIKKWFCLPNLQRSKIEKDCFKYCYTCTTIKKNNNLRFYEKIFLTFLSKVLKYLLKRVKSLFFINYVKNKHNSVYSEKFTINFTSFFNATVNFNKFLFLPRILRKIFKHWIQHG